MFWRRASRELFPTPRSPRTTTFTARMRGKTAHAVRSGEGGRPRHTRGRCYCSDRRHARSSSGWLPASAAPHLPTHTHTERERERAAEASIEREKEREKETPRSLALSLSHYLTVGPPPLSLCQSGTSRGGYVNHIRGSSKGGFFCFGGIFSIFWLLFFGEFLGLYFIILFGVGATWPSALRMLCSCHGPVRREPAGGV